MVQAHFGFSDPVIFSTVRKPKMGFHHNSRNAPGETKSPTPHQPAEMSRGRRPTTSPSPTRPASPTAMVPRERKRKRELRGPALRLATARFLARPSTRSTARAWTGTGRFRSCSPVRMDRRSSRSSRWASTTGSSAGPRTRSRISRRRARITSSAHVQSRAKLENGTLVQR